MVQVRVVIHEADMSCALDSTDEHIDVDDDQSHPWQRSLFNHCSDLSSKAATYNSASQNGLSDEWHARRVLLADHTNSTFV